MPIEEVFPTRFLSDTVRNSQSPRCYVHVARESKASSCHRRLRNRHVSPASGVASNIRHWNIAELQRSIAFDQSKPELNSLGSGEFFECSP